MSDQEKAALDEIRAIEDEARRVRDQGGDAAPLWQKAMALRKEHGLIEGPTSDMADDD